MFSRVRLSSGPAASSSNRGLHTTTAALWAPRSNWKFKGWLPVTIPPKNPLRYKQVYRPAVLRDAKKVLEKAYKSPWRGKWRVETVSVVERLPVIFKEPPKWWWEFEELQYELSQLYDKKYPDDIWEKLGEGVKLEDDGAGQKQSKTGQGKKKKESKTSTVNEEKNDEENKTTFNIDANMDRDYSLDEEEEDGGDSTVLGNLSSSAGVAVADRIRLEDFKVWPEGIDYLPEDFSPAPRVTAEDAADNRKSLNRALDKRLYLIVKKEGAEEPFEWQFLRKEWIKGDDEFHLHAQQNVENQIKAHKDCDFQVQFDTYHTAPSGHFFYEFPRDHQKKVKAFGTKQFFYHSYLLDGAPVVQMKANGYSDFAWVSRDELKEYLAPEYYEYVYDILQDF